MAGAIYFTKDAVQAAVGDGLNVLKAGEEALPQGAMADDAIKDQEAVTKAIQGLKERGLLAGDVTLVLHSSFILAKAVRVPMMKERELLEFCRSQFAESETEREELVYDYSVLERTDEAEKGGRILCCAVGKELLQSYARLFEAAGVKLSAVDISLNCAIKLMSQAEPLQKETYILEAVNGSNVHSLLFVDGKYLFSNSARLQDQPGSQGYAIDLSAKISSMIQFNRAQKTGREVEKVYVAGVSEETIRLTDEALFGLNVELLPLPDLVRFSGEGEFSLSRYFGPVSGLTRK